MDPCSAFSPWSPPVGLGFDKQPTAHTAQFTSAPGYFDNLPAQYQTSIQTSISRPTYKRSMFSASYGEVNYTPQTPQSHQTGWKNAATTKAECLAQWESTKIRLGEPDHSQSTSETGHKIKKHTDLNSPDSISSDRDVNSTSDLLRADKMTEVQTKQPINHSYHYHDSQDRRQFKPRPLLSPLQPGHPHGASTCHISQNQQSFVVKSSLLRP